jgi:hypothetical protein
VTRAVGKQQRIMLWTCETRRDCKRKLAIYEWVVVLAEGVGKEGNAHTRRLN